MPRPINRSEAIHTLLRLGYEIVAEEGNFVMLYDPDYPARQLKLDFGRGAIPWEDFQGQLEYEGVNVAVFLAELESAG